MTLIYFTTEKSVVIFFSSCCLCFYTLLPFMQISYVLFPMHFIIYFVCELYQSCL